MVTLTVLLAHATLFSPSVIHGGHVEEESTCTKEINSMDEGWLKIGVEGPTREVQRSELDHGRDWRPDPNQTVKDKVRILSNSPRVCGGAPSHGEDLGLGLPPPILAPQPNSTQRKYFGYFWRSSGRQTRLFAQVVNAKVAPVVMVTAREGHGWGREGFRAGRNGRGAGRGRGFSWHRDQEWH